MFNMHTLNIKQHDDDDDDKKGNAFCGNRRGTDFMIWGANEFPFYILITKIFDGHCNSILYPENEKEKLSEFLGADEFKNVRRTRTSNVRHKRHTS